MREQEIVKEFEKMGLQAAWTDVSKNGFYIEVLSLHLMDRLHR